MAQSLRLWACRMLSIREEALWSVLVYGVESMNYGILTFLGLYFVEVDKLSLVVATSLISAQAIGAIFGGYFGGWLSDCFGRRWVSSIALFLQMITLVMVLNSQNVVVLMGALFVLGVAAYAFISENNSCVLRMHQSTEERTMASGALSRISNLGIGVSVLIVGILGISHIKMIAFAEALILGGLAVGMMFQTSNQVVNRESQVSEKSDFKSHFGHPILFVFLLCMLFAGLVISQDKTVYTIYLYQSFFTKGILGIALMSCMNTFIVFLFQKKVLLLLKHIKLLYVFVGGVLFLGCARLILINPCTVVQPVLACGLYTLGELMFFPILQTLYYENCSEQKASGIGLLRSIYGLGLFIGPLIYGGVLRSLKLKDIWIITAIASVLVVALVLLVNRNKHEEYQIESC